MHVGKWPAVMLAAKRSAHVAQEVDLRECNCLKFLADTCPFLGPLEPLFWISDDVSSGFQSQSGCCLICLFFLRRQM